MMDHMVYSLHIQHKNKPIVHMFYSVVIYSLFVVALSMG